MQFRYLTVFLFLLLIPFSSFAGGVLVSSGEYAPYTGKDLVHGGFVNHVVEEAFHLVGVNVEFQYYPWARAFHLATIGESQAVSYVYKTKKRENEFFLSDGITGERLVLFTTKGTRLPSDWESLLDLKEYLFGVTRGFSYTDEFWDLVDRGVLKTGVAKSDKQNFMKLIKKRIDVFPADELVGYTLLRNEFAPGLSDTIRSSEKALAEHIGVLAFTKNKVGERLRDKFNLGLAQLKENGTYEKMYESLLNGYYTVRTDFREPPSE
ncbi:transporter substrate-binding domain-containing protein [Maridesulfovibrio sp.]|uniref:substrate-binding periplasmic protein n=1 Tax=Maridesulfovibrio sp. TaxID=2795000 RepID=UPI002A18C775|nr:transporter substrate-binding domain-containing protein [Maridesulfovibrio sp.]